MTGARTVALPLSPREAEVLRAVAEHLTNAEIAARLYISVRTVESHVAALLRKAGAADRRALIAEAPALLDPAAEPPQVRRSTVTSFIGRVAEREALAAALADHRLVTALGPGGVGKTRLAQIAMAEASDRYADGAWFVDLVPVSDPASVADAIAAVLSIHARQGRSLVDAIGSWLADRELLLVLDNCEHLVDGVAALVEDLLLASRGLTVLATSRTRLAVPFEWVFPVPGLSTAVGDGPGDAVQLFEARADAAGAAIGPELRPRIAAICAALDGIALAIELAAARLPSLGLDGLEAGLADRLPLLSGGRRADDRHRSLRATLDWSYALLPPIETAVLRRVSVFAAPFSATDAAAVAGPSSAAVLGVLSELVDSSLLTAELGPHGTRYRALETIRQYGAERLAEMGETETTRSAHLAWCVRRAEELPVPTGEDAPWQHAFDAIVEDLRAALGWARPRSEHRDLAFRLATRLASALFLRGLPAEAQRRFEEAAALAPNDATAADRLQAAAGTAETRQFGTESLRLREEAADAFVRAGDRPGAAIQLARAAELINRGPGILAPRPDPEEALPFLERVRALADGDPVALSRLLTAEAFAAPLKNPETMELARRAIELARRQRDAMGESAALDALCAAQLEVGDLPGATASALRRIRIMDTLPLSPEVGMELPDALAMSVECALGVGDLALAGRLADRIATLPFYRGEQHLATSRALIVSVLEGDLERCIGLATRFLDGWERAGRPRVSSLSPSPLAAAAAFAMRGDDGSAAEWREIALRLLTRPARPADYEVSGLEALVLLHRGRTAEAVARMAEPPEPVLSWYEATWRPWYAALWAEAAVLAGRGDAAERIERAGAIAAPNPIAVALLDRAAALLAGDVALLPAIADRLDGCGARYQAARTRIMAGGAFRERGEAELAACGAAPMVWPAG